MVRIEQSITGICNGEQRTIYVPYNDITETTDTKRKFQKDIPYTPCNSNCKRNDCPLFKNAPFIIYK